MIYVRLGILEQQIKIFELETILVPMDLGKEMISKPSKPKL